MTAAPGAAQEEVDAGQEPCPPVVVLDLKQQRFDFPDLAVRLELRRQQAGVPEYAMGNAQVLGHQGVVVEFERDSRARKVIEITALLRLAYAAFSDEIEDHARCSFDHNGCRLVSLSDAANPWMTSFTLLQCFSRFMAASQRSTFGKAA